MGQSLRTTTGKVRGQEKRRKGRASGSDVVLRTQPYKRGPGGVLRWAALARLLTPLGSISGWKLPTKDTAWAGRDRGSQRPSANSTPPPSALSENVLYQLLH